MISLWKDLSFFLKGLIKYHLSKVSLAEFFKLMIMTKNIIFISKRYTYIQLLTHSCITSLSDPYSCIFYSIFLIAIDDPVNYFKTHKVVTAQNWEITGRDVNIRCPMELFSERFVTRILQRPLVFIPGSLCKVSGTKVFYLNRRSSTPPPRQRARL